MSTVVQLPPPLPFLGDASSRRVADLESRLVALESKVGALAAAAPSDRVTIVCFSGDFDKLVASFVIATGAAAMGSEVSLFFCFWGLSALKKKSRFRGKSITDKLLSAAIPSGAGGTSKMNMLGIGPVFFKSLMKKKNIANLRQLMDLARELEVKMMACSMSMDVMAVTQEELVDGVVLGGVASYLEDAADSRVTLFV